MIAECFRLDLKLQFSKKFTLLVAYRGNINTNPKFGLMNNISIGNKFNL